ncbi:hypothetical protein Nepgr_022294 [Nepenthes gracilis]|uniref:RNA helicase n=1 Tax=Nepenthes gracilis TaxID=150966 RepID=A0AAD3T008_NEPGR|nr:hypothetical protein Nepgr_022294 [Nepenthes gracilis]
MTSLMKSMNDDSNAFILRGKKGKMKKAKTRICDNSKSSKRKKLSKSQKKKLEKLAEEKEKKLLLSKSLETLEKCKISEDAYSLLWSSRNIGQADTTREKRRRILQFSKAGLEVPYNDKVFKRKSLHEDSCEMRSEAEKRHRPKLSDGEIAVQPVVVDKNSTSTVPSASHGPFWGSGPRNGKSDTQCWFEEVANEVNCIPMQVKMGNSSSICLSYKDKQTLTAMGEVEDNQNVGLTGANSVGDHPTCQAMSRPTILHVSRPEEVENLRKDLPIVMMEQEIMEAINEHICIIICGETGCGKTTQVPQFLYEAGFGSNKSSMRSGVIGITQPRRVAVLATAKRVAFELSLCLGKEVGFQVRHDKRIGENCSIKFMTDGILLREVQSDFLLKRYSVIILDEAHERSLNTDILIGMLSRVIRQRQFIFKEQQRKLLSGEEIKTESRIFPLKLILMSATLRVEDFTSGTKIFPDTPPVKEVPARQFPVTKYFSKRTEIVDYIGQAYKKVMSIHKKLPAGGILVFVTGQREVEYLCSMLRNASRELIKKSTRGNTGNADNAETDMDEIDGCDMNEISEALDMCANSTQQETDRFSSFDDYHGDSDADEFDNSCISGTDSDLDVECNDGDFMDQNNADADGNLAEVFSEGRDLDALRASFEALAGKIVLKSDQDQKQNDPKTLEECSNKSNLRAKEKSREKNGPSIGPMHVLPLYAMLPAAAQLRVFGEKKLGERLVVVATNVAETSLTIPGIKYVVDTGREKVKNYNSSSGMESYEIQWISKASAEQRAGRAGRTGPGHCYRLYSSAVFNNLFCDFSCAEISKIPVDGVVLLMKSMGISKVANFPFPTPPDATALIEAERCLKALDALDSEGRITPLGKSMAQYPMSPRHSRMLLTAIQIMKKDKQYVRPNLVLGFAVAAAAALSLSNPFVLRFERSITNADSTEQNERCDALDSLKISPDQKKSNKKKLKEAAKLSCAKFSHLRSDALTVAYALQCFELSKSPSEFCNYNALHQKTMEEMSKLRKQILHLVFNQRLSAMEEFSWTYGKMEDVEHAWRVPFDKNPLSQIEEDVICQSICAGWADRVAKRIRGSDKLLAGDRKVNAVRYQACMVKEIVFLHRWSSLSKSAPEFLVYSELLHTKRPYIHGATSVESQWLVKYAESACTYSAPLTDPKPCYQYLSDQVFCHVIPYFGPHLWVLPNCKVPIRDVLQRVAAFAYSLLDGQVLPCLKPVRKFMAAQPSIILRPEASGQKRIGNLLSKLNTLSRTIDSCAMLREVWKENPRALYLEILDWFQTGFHVKFEELWANMQHECDDILSRAPNAAYERSTKTSAADYLVRLCRNRFFKE